MTWSLRIVGTGDERAAGKALAAAIYELDGISEAQFFGAEFTGDVRNVEFAEPVAVPSAPDPVPEPQPATPAPVEGTIT